jgi:hypothetical protein
LSRPDLILTQQGRVDEKEQLGNVAALFIIGTGSTNHRFDHFD